MLPCEIRPYVAITLRPFSRDVAQRDDKGSVGRELRGAAALRRGSGFCGAASASCSMGLATGCTEKFKSKLPAPAKLVSRLNRAKTFVNMQIPPNDDRSAF